MHSFRSAVDADDLATTLAEHPFLDGFDADEIQAVAPLAQRVLVAPDRLVLRHGKPADAFYLVLDGDVALEVPRPGDAPLVVGSVHAGDALGWSWLFAPYRWALDARAVTETTAIELDAAGMRALMDEHPELGLRLSHRVGQLVVDRLRHARFQLAAARAH